MTSMYERPRDCPTIYQWDPSSRLPLPDPGTAPGNCGSTCMTHMANYYQDANFGIYTTRRLAVWDDSKMSTTIGEQSTMLAKRGVPNAIDRLQLSTLHYYLKSQRRPITIGMDMSKVRPGIRGHDFTGSHAVELRANTTRDGLTGFSVMDPNFNRTYRTDPTNGHRFYPDYDVLNAYWYPGTYWAVVPLNDKQVPPPWYGRVRVARPDSSGIRIRDSAKEITGNVWAIARRDGYTYSVHGPRLFRNSYEYAWDGEIRTGENGVRFYVVRTHAGDGKFIRVGSAVVVRKA